MATQTTSQLTQAEIDKANASYKQAISSIGSSAGNIGGTGALSSNLVDLTKTSFSEAQLAAYASQAKQVAAKLSVPIVQASNTVQTSSDVAKSTLTQDADIAKLKNQIAQASATMKATDLSTGLGDAAKGVSGTSVLDTTRVSSSAGSYDVKALTDATAGVKSQYEKDSALLQQAWKDAKIDGIELEARQKYLDDAMANGTYMDDREGGVTGLEEQTTTTTTDTTGTDGSSSSGTGDNAGGTAGSSTTADPNGTGIGSNGADTKVINVDDYIGNHSGLGARLTQFIHSNGDDDHDRLSYIKLVDYGKMKDVAFGDNKQYMDAIYTVLTERYDKCIITNVQESRSERTSIMPTVGDSFAATFSGMEPMVVSISGMLIFDYDRGRMSWYTAFMNAYQHYLRASQLAKWRARMKLVLPDYTEYVGYILSITSTQSSENDMVIPFNFSMLTVNEQFNKAYGMAVDSTSSTTDTTKTVTSDAAQTATGQKVEMFEDVDSLVKDPAAIAAARQAQLQAQQQAKQQSSGNNSTNPLDYIKMGVAAYDKYTSVLGNLQSKVNTIGARVRRPL